MQRQANADALKSALKGASSPEQRTQAISAFRQKNAAVQKQFAAVLKSQEPAPTPSQQFLDSLSEDRKAAIEQRLALWKQLKQITASGNGMTPAQRSSALAAWRKSYAKTKDQFHASLPVRTSAAGNSAANEAAFAKTLPPSLQKAHADMAQIENDRKTLVASTAGMTPVQRAGAWQQWAATVRTKLKTYRDQLKAAETAASSQSTTPH